MAAQHLAPMLNRIGARRTSRRHFLVLGLVGSVVAVAVALSAQQTRLPGLWPRRRPSQS